MGSKTSLRPPKLEPGQRIALVAPAGPLLERDDLRRGVELCRALGYEPVLGRHAGGHDGYLAGTDRERLDDLNAALRDPAIAAVWCLRGGYGMTRILDGVDFAALAARPKPVIGFSDVTALLNAILARAGVVAFHGPMARSQLTPFSRFHFDRVLTLPGAAGRLGRVAPPADVLVPEAARIVPLTPGVADGTLVGGNCTLLQCLVGTPYLPDLDGAILVLEDVDEDLYRVDRMLSHFRLAGVLQRLAGVVIGRFTGMRRGGGDGATGFDRMLLSYFEPLGIPVALGFPVGHVDDQWTLPLGVRARLDAAAGELELLEPAVR